MATYYRAIDYPREQILSTREEWPKCSGKETRDVYTITSSGQRVVDLYSTRERRRKPALPLYKSMTALPERIRRIHSYALQKRTVYQSSCTPITKWKQFDRYFIPTDTSELDAPISDGVVDLAIRLKVKDISQNLASYIGEYRETCDLVAKSGNKVSSAVRTAAGIIRSGKAPKRWLRGMKYRKLKKLTKQQALEAAQSISATVLVSDFMLAPTLSDVSAAMERLNRLTRLPMTRKVQVTRRAHAQKVTKGLYGGALTQNTTHSVRKTMWVEYNPDRISEFTSGNILEALWEGIAFSFVVDYFINVGQYLSGLDAMSGVLNAYGCVTDHKQSYNFDDRPSGSNYEVERPASVTVKRVSRRVSNSVSYGRPSWSPSGSWRRLRDMVSVLVLQRGR